MNSISFAFRNVWRNYRRTLLTSSTVAAAALAIVMSVGYMKATFDAVREGTISGGVGHAQIVHQGFFDKIDEKPLQYALSAEEVQSADAFLKTRGDVETYTRTVNFEGLISNGDLSYAFVGESYEPAHETKNYLDYRQITGRPLSKDDKGTTVLLGSELARKLGLHAGSIATLMVATAKGGVNAVDAEVVGILSTGVKELDGRLVNMSVSQVQELLITDKVSRMVVYLKDTADTDPFVSDASKALPGLEIHSWLSLASFYKQLVALYKNEYSVFGVILLVTIFLSLTNSILMTVWERKQEVSTLRAIGLPGHLLSKVFVLEGTFIAGLGALAGCIAGNVLIEVLNAAHIMLPAPPGRVKPVPLEFAGSMRATIIVILVLLVVGAVAALFASRKLQHGDILSGLEA